MTSRLHKLAALSAVLAAGTFAPPALASHQPAGDVQPVRIHQDLRSPDARDAALHPRYMHRGPVSPPAPHTAASGSDGGPDAPPLAGGIAVLAVACGIGLSLRRRQARSMA